MKTMFNLHLSSPIYKAAVFCILALLISCRKNDPAADDALSVHVSGTHYEYYYSASDKDGIDTTWQEAYFAWLVAALDVKVNTKIEFDKYRDRAHLKRMTGRDTNGFSDTSSYRFHTIWKIDNHEGVHTIIIRLIGLPPPLFNEGIAVAFQADYFKYPLFIPEWNGVRLDLLAKTYNQDGKTPSLDNLLGTWSFWNFDTNITYPVAGSFVRYLIDHYGLAKMKSYISSSKFEDSKDQIHVHFMAAYGMTIETAWNEWQIFISQ